MTVTGLGLSGADAGKYRLGAVTVTGAITARGVTVGGLGLVVKEYDGDVTAADFGLRVGTGTNLVTWTTGPAPSAVAVRRGAGVQGSDRVTLTWADGAIRNRWMEVRVRTGARTGLSGEDVFYLGNVVAETGDSALDLLVTSTDMNRIRLAVANAPVGARSVFDIDRDGWVNSTDVTLARLNVTSDLRLEVKLLDLRSMATGGATGFSR